MEGVSSSTNARHAQDSEESVVKVMGSAIQRSRPWFDDGNIILEAERLHFRVYRGILSANSEVFRDMLSLGQSVTEDHIDGCAVVHLSDSASDVRIVLEVLHDSHKLHFSDKKKLTMPVVTACYRLGRKYDISHLQAEAHRRLLHEFPSTLDNFNQFWRDGQAIEGYSGYITDVVDFAREQALLSILPTAFYFSCRFTNEQILRGRERPDGSIARLGPEDQIRCVIGREKLFELQATETFGWLTASAIDCNTKRCAIAKARIMKEIWMPPTTIVRALNVWSPSWVTDLCHKCEAEAIRKHKEGREKIWSILPSIFGLPSWDDLTND